MSTRTRVYLKKTCPFCLKLRIFMTEAGIADRFDFTVFGDGDETHKAVRARMQAAGQEPSFPAAELEPGKLTTGTDDLIARFAREAGVDPATMPLSLLPRRFLRHGECSASFVSSRANDGTHARMSAACSGQTGAPGSLHTGLPGRCCRQSRDCGGPSAAVPVEASTRSSLSSISPR